MPVILSGPIDRSAGSATITEKSIESAECIVAVADPLKGYSFYIEAGVWTIYAILKSQRGTYETSKPEDFVTIEINDVSPTKMDVLLAGLPVIG